MSYRQVIRFFTRAPDPTAEATVVPRFLPWILAMFIPGMREALDMHAFSHRRQQLLYAKAHEVSAPSPLHHYQHRWLKGKN
jgi:hypothetical protein